MGAIVVPPAVLEKLRTIGDPELEALQGGLTAAMRAGGDVRTATIEALRGSYPVSNTVTPDPDLLFVAQRLFAMYSTEISGALLLAALPQSYATEYGAAVLGASAQLQTDLTRRIRETARFLLIVTQRASGKTHNDQLKHQNQLWNWSKWDGTTPAEPTPWERCVELRMFHHYERNVLEDKRSRQPYIDELLGKENHPPLNQEDLLGMLLTFSFAVFEVLDRYGITWSAEEQEAYLHLWDVIGSYLGIGSDAVIERLGTGSQTQSLTNSASSPQVTRQPFVVGADWHGLRPPTIGESRALLDQIRARQWKELRTGDNDDPWPWTALRSGRVLTRALLEELNKGMPQSLQLLPIAVMRALNPPIVGRRLNLGGNGVLLQSLTLLPKRRARVARFTSIQSPNWLGGRVLRFLANDVTTRASMHLVDAGNLTIPGTDDWS